MSDADTRNDITVQEYIATIEDAQMVEDSQTLIKMMQKISGSEPRLYGIGTIGFGIYHYKYESGRAGDAHTLGFYPRKGKITVYLMDGTARYSEQLAKLGKHTTTGYCIYIKRLSDVQIPVLQQILTESYIHITTLYKKGPIDHILCQAED